MKNETDMDLRTKAEIKREERDQLIRRDFNQYIAEGYAKCRIVAAMTRDPKYGYSSANSIYRSLKRTSL